MTMGVLGGVPSHNMPSDDPTDPHNPAPFLALTEKKYVLPVSSVRPVFVPEADAPVDVHSPTSVAQVDVPIAY